jgi:hypothetical protein
VADDHFDVRLGLQIIHDQITVVRDDHRYLFVRVFSRE